MKTQHNVQEATDNLVAVAHKSVDRVAESIGSAEAKIKEGAKNLIEKEKVMVEQARSLLGTNPIRSVAIAAVSGIIIGWLINR